MVLAYAVLPCGVASAQPAGQPGVSGPDGARGRTAEGQVYCEPTVCSRSAECGRGWRCSTEPISFCVTSASGVREALFGGCGPDGACVAGYARCETSRRCVSSAEGDDDLERLGLPPADPGPETSGCGCRAASTAPGASWAMLVALVVWRWRR